MSNKIQGEGDYEAARRFNKDEQDFVKRKYSKKHAADKQDLDVPPPADQDDDDTFEVRNPSIKFPKHG